MSSVHKQWHDVRWWSCQLAIFLGAIVVAFLCLEVGFRIARRGEIGFDRLGWERDSGAKDGGRTYAKTEEFEFSANVNHLGFRGPEVSEDKPKGTKRILILGDSFIFGWGVNDDQLFTYRLAKELEKHGQQFEIINTAGGSLSPLVYYVRLKNRYLRLKPDVMFLFLNYADLREDYTFKRIVIRDDNGEIIDLDPLYTDGQLDAWKWLRNRSEFLSFTYNKFNRTFSRIRILGLWRYIEANLKGERMRDAMFEDDKSLGKTLDAIEYDPYFMLRDYAKAELIQKHLAETTSFIARIHELAKQQGSSLILILHPNGVQVGPRQWREGRRRWGFEEGRIYENPLMADELTSITRRTGIAFVNLTDAFKANNSRQLFFERDGHMNSEGHAVLTNGLLAAPAIRTALAVR